MQRGRIIQYNPNSGSGIVLVGEEQRPFEISSWRGAEAPQLNRVTEVREENGAVLSITPVSERVLLAEKATVLKSELGALGSSLGSIGATLGSRAAGAMSDAARNIGTGNDSAAALPTSMRIDRPVIAGYAAFAFATAVLTFISIQIPFFGDRNMTLLAATGLAEQVGSTVRPLLFAAYLSILVPLVWKERRAWLALAVPLLALVLMIWSAQQAFSAPFGGGGNAAGMAGFLGPEEVAEMRRAASEMFSFGLGFYASLAAALYLGWLAIRRGLGRA